MNSLPSEIMDPPRSFIGLSQDECHYLETWLNAAATRDIDSAADLTGRAWPCPIDGAAIGVYTSGADTASWLVVKHNGQWAVACCTDLTVSRSVSTLAEALQTIYPGDATPEVSA
jgi:hypothetical protein